jgi:hypothetical protein
MGTPIAGLDNVSILNAYKLNFGKLTQKEYRPRLNVMDNQATKYIKKFLPEKSARYSSLGLTIIESMQPSSPYKLKDAFIPVLGTINQDFLLQLWDEITPQVINMLNMMRALSVDLTKSG